MNDLFPIEARPEAFFSSQFRIEPVRGDSMAPTLRANRDFIVVRPVDTYVGEGLYLFSQGFWQDLYRAEATIGRERAIRLYRDNTRYSEQLVTRAQFDEMVLAIVVADISVRDERFLREAMTA